MKTKLPKEFVGNGLAATAYSKFIDSFSQSDYEKKNSCKLANLVLNELDEWTGTSGAKDSGQQKKTISGTVFEFLVGEMLVMHNIVPFYAQAQMWKVPMSRVDFLLYDEDAPVILTCKLSLAERWRQAAFEGIFLKNIYRRGRCYLISAKSQDVINRNKDIEKREIEGIDKCYMVNSKEFDELLKELSNRKFCVAKDVNPVKGTPKIIQKTKRT